MRKLSIFSAAFALAAAVYVYGLADEHALWLVPGALVLSVLCRVLSLRRVCVFFLGAAIALIWCVGYEQVFLKNIVLLDNTQAEVSVQITQIPSRTDTGASVCCKLQGHEAVLSADETLLSVLPGDTVSCTAQIRIRTDDLYYRADGTVVSLYADGDIQIVRGTPNMIQRLRIFLQTRIGQLYDGEAKGLVKALLTGDRSELSYETSNALSVSGLSHAVAVSGMHVSILITVVAMLCGYEPRLMALFGIPAAVIFAFMTGASPSVCRAAVMQSMLLLAPIVRRERDNATTLAASALLLLLQNPWCIASVSFQLSFAAVAGLMLFSSPFQMRILGMKKKPGRVLRFLASGTSATLSATLSTLPLTVFYFGIVSIAAPIINLLVLWAVTGVFVLGFCSCILGPLGPAAAWVTKLLSGYILGAAKLAASVPYAAAYPHNVPLMVWAVLLYVAAAAILLVKKLPIRMILCAITASFLICVLHSHVRFTSYPWRVTVLDVGQGQCIVMQIEDFTAVVDCGGSDPQGAGEKAARFLHSAGIAHVDALILTHYDADHAGGAEQFLGRIRTGAVYLPPAKEDNEIAAAIRQLAPTYEVTEQLELTLPTGAVTVLPPVLQENENNGVCVLMTAGEYDMLITGDLDDLAEMRLMSVWELPDVELMVAGHHGAKSSTSQVLLDKVRPEKVAISVDADNRYGHPHRQTLDRLHSIGAQVYRTDLMGDLYFYP